MNDNIYLVRPALEMKEEALAYREEHFVNGEKIICGSELFDQTESYEEWLESVTRNTSCETVNENWVVTDTFFAVRKSDNRIIGMIDLRHTLNDFLKDLGKAAGMEEIHISVEKENAASLKVIQRNGGVYERSFDHEGTTADIYKICLK